MSGSMSVLTPIGWALLHFVWQGVLFALALAAILWLVPARAARVRYALACLALAAMAMAPVATLAWIAADPFVIAASSASSAGTNGSGFGLNAAESLSSIASSAASASTGARTSTADLSRMLPLLSVLWVCGVACCAVRLAGGWWQTRRLIRRDTSEPDGEWQALVSDLSDRIGLRRAVRVLSSARIDVPVVAGAVVPVLLLPVSALSGLTPRQVEAVIAHELAHIRRHDYLVNLVQSAVECLLFYHPAVWWVSHVIRVEREHCCDDLAVLACGDPLMYARALTNMEALRRGDVGMAMAASGGSLLSRVRRLVGARPPARMGSSGWVLAATTVLMVAGAGATNWVSGWAAVLPDMDMMGPQASTCCPSSIRSNVAATATPRESSAPAGTAEATPRSEPSVGAASTEASPVLAVDRFEGAVAAASASADVADVVDLIDSLQRSVRDLSRAAAVRARALERMDLQRQLRDTARQLRGLRAARAVSSGALTRQLQAAERVQRDQLRQNVDAIRLMTRGRALAQRAQRWCRDNDGVPPPPPVPPAAASPAVPPPPPAVSVQPAVPLPPNPNASDVPPAIAPLPPAAPSKIAPVAPPAAPPPLPPPAAIVPGAPLAAPPQPPPPAAMVPGAAPPYPAPVPPAAAPAPPPPPAHALAQLDAGGTWFMSMSENGHKLSVHAKGRIELTDGFDDVKSLEPGGYFTIETGSEEAGKKGTSKFTATRKSNGSIERAYVVDGRSVGSDEGREWLARTLPAFVRDHASAKRLAR